MLFNSELTQSKTDSRENAGVKPPLGRESHLCSKQTNTNKQTKHTNNQGPFTQTVTLTATQTKCLCCCCWYKHKKTKVSFLTRELCWCFIAQTSQGLLLLRNKNQLSERTASTHTFRRTYTHTHTNIRARAQTHTQRRVLCQHTVVTSLCFHPISCDCAAVWGVASGFLRIMWRKGEFL